MCLSVCVCVSVCVSVCLFVCDKKKVCWHQYVRVTHSMKKSVHNSSWSWQRTPTTGPEGGSPDDLTHPPVVVRCLIQGWLIITSPPLDPHPWPVDTSPFEHKPPVYHQRDPVLAPCCCFFSVWPWSSPQAQSMKKNLNPSTGMYEGRHALHPSSLFYLFLSKGPQKGVLISSMIWGYSRKIQ